MARPPSATLTKAQATSPPPRKGAKAADGAGGQTPASAPASARRLQPPSASPAKLQACSPAEAGTASPCEAALRLPRATRRAEGPVDFSGANAGRPPRKSAVLREATDQSPAGVFGCFRRRRASCISREVLALLPQSPGCAASVAGTGRSRQGKCKAAPAGSSPPAKKRIRHKGPSDAKAPEKGAAGVKRQRTASVGTGTPACQATAEREEPKEEKEEDESEAETARDQEQQQAAPTPGRSPRGGEGASPGSGAEGCAGGGEGQPAQRHRSSPTKQKRVATPRVEAGESAAGSPAQAQAAAAQPAAPRDGAPCFAATGLELSARRRRALEELGIAVALEWTPRITHVVADTFRRTTKMMCAICVGAHIVTPEYIPACRAAGRLLPEDAFALRDAVCEQAFARKRGITGGYSLAAALERARRAGPLLRGVSVYCFPSVAEKRELPLLVAAAGGIWLSKFPVDRADDEAVLMLAERTVSGWREQKRRQEHRVYDVELLREAACTQVIRKTAYRLR